MNAVTQTAIYEVYNSHILMQEWFNGSDKATPQLLEQLLLIFSPEFSMIDYL